MKGGHEWKGNKPKSGIHFQDGCQTTHIAKHTKIRTKLVRVYCFSGTTRFGNYEPETGNDRVKLINELNCRRSKD